MGSVGGNSVLSRVDGTSRFYGDYQNISNQYFKFDHVIDDNNIILITSNVVYVKGNPVLVVDDNKAVYLKDWNMQPVKIRNVGDAWAVKLNRDYFKPYTFRSNFDEFGFDKQQSFDDLKKIAKSQNKTPIARNKRVISW